MCSTLPSVPPSPAPDPTVAVLQVHLILRHKSPKTGAVEEKHLTVPPTLIDDSKTHVYTAILRAADNTCVCCAMRACAHASRPARPCCALHLGCVDGQGVSLRRGPGRRPRQVPAKCQRLASPLQLVHSALPALPCPAPDLQLRGACGR